MKHREFVVFFTSSSYIPKTRLTAGAPTGDLLTDGLVEDEKIIDREKEEQKDPASCVPREQGKDRVGQDGQEGGEMKEGE